MRAIRVPAFSMITTALLASSFVRAQEATNPADINAVAQQIDQQYADALAQKQSELTQGQAALRDCAAQDEARKNDQAAQKAQDDGQRQADQAQKALGNQAPGGGIPGNLQKVADTILGNGATARRQADQQLNNIALNVKQINQGFLDAARSQDAKKIAEKVQSKDQKTIDESFGGNSEAADAFVAQVNAADTINSEVINYNKATGATVNSNALQIACNNPIFRQQYATSFGAVTASVTNNQRISYGMENARTCIQNVRYDVANSNEQFAKAMTNKANGQSISSGLMQAGLNTLVGSLGAKAGAKAAQGHADDTAAAQAANNDGQLANCQQAANDQIAAVKAAMSDLGDKRSRALADARLRAAAAGQRSTASLGSNGSAGGAVSAGAPANLTAAKAGPAGGGGAAPAAGSPAGMAGGGGGGGGGGGADWTFGSGNGFGGIGPGGPLEQPSFETAGGGGGGGGGYGGFGGEGSSFGPDLFTDPNAGRGYAANTDAEGFGDGGILTLMARARERVSNHADQLVQSIDLKKLATGPVQ